MGVVLGLLFWRKDRGWDITERDVDRNVRAFVCVCVCVLRKKIVLSNLTFYLIEGKSGLR